MRHVSRDEAVLVASYGVSLLAWVYIHAWYLAKINSLTELSEQWKGLALNEVRRERR